MKHRKDQSWTHVALILFTSPLYPQLAFGFKPSCSKSDSQRKSKSKSKAKKSMLMISFWARSRVQRPRSAQAKPSQVKPSKATPNQAQPSQAKPSQTQTKPSLSQAQQHPKRKPYKHRVPHVAHNQTQNRVQAGRDTPEHAKAKTDGASRTPRSASRVSK